MDEQEWFQLLKVGDYQTFLQEIIPILDDEKTSERIKKLLAKLKELSKELEVNQIPTYFHDQFGNSLTLYQLGKIWQNVYPSELFSKSESKVKIKEDFEKNQIKIKIKLKLKIKREQDEKPEQKEESLF